MDWTEKGVVEDWIVVIGLAIAILLAIGLWLLVLWLKEEKIRVPSAVAQGRWQSGFSNRHQNWMEGQRKRSLNLMLVMTFVLDKSAFQWNRQSLLRQEWAEEYA
jgi:hypothetical protein